MEGKTIMKELKERIMSENEVNNLYMINIEVAESISDYHLQTCEDELINMNLDVEIEYCNMCNKAMYIEFREYIWNRCSIPEDKIAKVMKELKEGNITDSNDITRICNGEESWTNLIDTTTPMSLQDNGDYSTVEVFVEDNLIYENGTEGRQISIEEQELNFN